MWSQASVEFLKLLASIATPILIAVFGLLINRTIQRQNAAMQRQTSWLAKWADDFLTAASGLNESATNFLMKYWWSNLKVSNDWPGADEDQKRLHLEVVPIILDLERWNWEISKFAGFALQSGNNLSDAANQLVDEARSWLANRGGNVQVFREKQLEFNRRVRRMHAELLNLEKQKD